LNKFITVAALAGILSCVPGIGNKEPLVALLLAIDIIHHNTESR
jgi:hypothetical protein